LGMMSEAQIQQIFAWEGTDLSRMQAHGSYPKERALVSFAHLNLGLSPLDLISEPMGKDEIMKAVEASDLRGEL